MSPAQLSYFSPIGRLLIATPFLLAGPGKLMAPKATAAYMATGGLPENAMLAIGTGSFEIVAGVAILLGYQARWAAIALAVFTLLASLLFHPYWSVPADQQVVQQLLFSKNIAIIGSLLFLTAIGAGPWSVDSHRPPRPV